MAKKDKDKNNQDSQELKEEGAGGKILTILIVVIIVIIWLAIFGVLIKLDVGNFGSEVLYPVLKDVPVVNHILPTVESEDKTNNEEYDNLREANARIRELERQLAATSSSDDANNSQIDELKAEGIEPGDQEYDSYLVNHGIKPGETGSDSSVDAEDITPPQRPAVVEAQEGAEGPNDAPKKSLVKQMIDGAVGAAKFFGGPDVTIGDGVKAAAKIGTTIAAAGIGLGMGDMKSAVGLGMTAYGISDRIDNAIDSHKNNLQLEKNEEIYDQRYEEYVEQYKKLVDPDATEDQIRDELTTLFEKYDDGSLNYDSIKNEQEKELKRKFLKDSYAELRDSYKATGGEKPGDLAKAYTVNKASAKYRKKHFSE